MSAKIKYTDEPLRKIEVVADMLPSPKDLAFKGLGHETRQSGQGA